MNIWHWQRGASMPQNKFASAVSVHFQRKTMILDIPNRSKMALAIKIDDDYASIT